MKIDLTYKIEIDNPVFGKFTDPDKAYLNSGHIGTHLDLHAGTEVPLDYIKNRGVLIDISENSGIEVLPDKIDLSGIKENDFVIFRTDVIKRYGYGSEKYLSGGVQLSYQLIDYLLEKRIRFIGIDASDIRNPEEHTTFCKENRLFITGGSDYHGIFNSKIPGVPKINIDRHSIDDIIDRESIQI